MHNPYQVNILFSILDETNADLGHENSWIGGVLETGTFPGALGGWGWMDESAFDFSAWAEDEPSGPEDIEQCIEMWTNGLWNDAKCTKVIFRFLQLIRY